jgi:hypothetical protein
MRQKPEVNETEDRLHLNRPLFEQPGTSQPRRYAARARATELRWDRGEGRSPRAERRATEKAATPAPKSLAELMASVKAMASSSELARLRAAGSARQVTKKLVDENRPSGVWQMGSWTNGDAPCPDERLEWLSM